MSARYSARRPPLRTLLLRLAPRANADRFPLRAVVDSYAGDLCIGSSQERFFAGDEALTITFPLALEPGADGYRISIRSPDAPSGRLVLESPRVVCGLTEYWFGRESHVERPIRLDKDWWQEGSRLFCRSYFGEHSADMPDGWMLDAVHPAAFQAAEWLMYNRLEQHYFGVERSAPALERPRPRGSNTRLTFSMGADSTAALTLLPDSVLKDYVARPYDTYLTSRGARIRLPSHAVHEPGLAKVTRLTMAHSTFERRGSRRGRGTGRGCHRAPARSGCCWPTISTRAGSRSAR